MITESVKNLFDFIDFLHKKIPDFLTLQPLIDEVMALHTKRNSLKPDQNFKDRIEYNKVQDEFLKKSDVIRKETTLVMIGKMQELSIANFSNGIYYLNANTDLFKLQKEFSEDDLAEIFAAKAKYFEVRENADFLSYWLGSVIFYDLDRELIEFFDYFKESTHSWEILEWASTEEIKQFFQAQEKPYDFTPLKKYIRENYLNVHPNKLTLERLEQIRQNISTWKLQLKDLNEAPELQEFISETMADIDLKIDRFGTNKKEPESEFSYIEKKENETVQTEFSETIKKETEPATLADIFPENEVAVSIIKEALKDLNITKFSKEREITGFIEGCKLANRLPNIADTILIKVIYAELGIRKINPKPRYSDNPYKGSLHKTKDYFGIK